MKKFLVAAVALLVAVTASAEGFGLVGGFTSSKVKMEEITFRNSAGIHAGIAYNVPLIAGFAIQPELVYNVKGFNWEGSSAEGYGLRQQAKYGYVEVPVQLQWGPDLLLLRPYVFAEPFIGFAVNGMQTYNEKKIKVDWDDVKSRLEYGMGVGAGLELMNRFQLSFKYFWNVEDANQWINLDAVSEHVKSRSFNGLLFSVGLFF